MNAKHAQESIVKTEIQIIKRGEITCIQGYALI